eukprot:SAG31_NODE_2977_length_4833_cov_5.035488_4_plen_168_part_00
MGRPAGAPGRRIAARTCYYNWRIYRLDLRSNHAADCMNRRRAKSSCTSKSHYSLAPHQPNSTPKPEHTPDNFKQQTHLSCLYAPSYFVHSSQLQQFSGWSATNPLDRPQQRALPPPCAKHLALWVPLQWLFPVVLESRSVLQICVANFRSDQSSHLSTSGVRRHGLH